MTIVSWVAYVACSLILILMSIEDWIDMEVRGILCYVGWALAFFTTAIRHNHIAVTTIIVLLFIVYLLPIEIPVFGDADFIPVSMVLAFYGTRDIFQGLNIVPLMFMLVMMLLTMYPYAKFYYRKQGKVFKLFTGMYVPMLPIFTLSWCISILGIVGYEYLLYAYPLTFGGYI